MSKIDEDIYQTRLLINRESSKSNYGYIYFASNEELRKLFGSFDLEKKDVLSVVGSGDQAFYFLNSSVNSIDLYDMNKLSIYYFYLRKWIIELFDGFYLKYPFPEKYLKYLLDNVVPCFADEKNALSYWKKCVSEFGVDNLSRLFYSPSYWNYIPDVSKIKKRLENNHFIFYNCDISSDISIDKKYDIVFVSNIIDHLSDVDKITMFKNNLFNLLKDDGIIIASKVCSCNISDNEKRIFEESFNLHTIHGNNDDDNCLRYLPGYYYTKRK